MYPVLFKIGSFELSSFGLVLAVGFLFMSFIIWRTAKNFGIEDDKILDNIIVITTSAIIGARLGYVLYHLDIFFPNIIRIAVLWRFPGLSYLGAIVGGVVAMYLYSKKQKLRFTKIAVSYCKSLGALLIFGSFAVFLDGTVVGRSAKGWFLAMPSVGETGLRHPVGLYGVMIGILIQLLLVVFEKYLFKDKQTKDSLYIWLTILLTGVFFLVLAFTRDDLLYLGGFSLEYVTSASLIFVSTIALFKLSGSATKIIAVLKSTVEFLKKKVRKL